MPDNEVDPRHSPEFQRGTDPRVVASMMVPPPAVAPPPVAASGPSDTEVDDDAAARREAAARRVFTRWTVILFVVGAALCVLAMALFAQFQYMRQSTYLMSTDVSTPTLTGFQFALVQFLGSLAPLAVAVIGLGTIVANLFRIAARSVATAR